MTEAVEPITAYAFNLLGFDRLILGNAVGNLRSRRIKEKAGAKWLRAEPAKFVNPVYTEREIWVLTKEDWRSLGSGDTSPQACQNPSSPAKAGDPRLTKKPEFAYNNENFTKAWIPGFRRG